MKNLRKKNLENSGKTFHFYTSKNICIYSFYLKFRERERLTGGERVNFYVLVFSQDGYSGQSRAAPKLGSRRFFCLSHIDAAAVSSHRHGADWKQSSWDSYQRPYGRLVLQAEACYVTI